MKTYITFYRLSFFIVTLFFCLPVMGQQELNLHHYRDLYQSAKTNPAFLTNHKFAVGFPSLFYNLSLPIAYDDVVRQENGKTLIDIDDLIDASTDENDIFLQFEVTTLDVTFPIKDVRIQLYHALKFSNHLRYPKSFLQLGWQGNSQFVGETVEFAPEINVMGYNEYGIGVAHTFDEKIHVGGRIKLLAGFGNITTEKSNASLFTDDDIYQLTLNSDYEIRSSALLDINDLTDIQVDLNDTETADLITKNSGFALDLGASLDLTDKLNLSLSVLDIGSITWKENVRNYTSQGSYTYEGLVFEDVFDLDSLSFDDALDSLENTFDFVEDNEDYSTSLPLKVYAGARYALRENLHLSGTIYIERYPQQTFPALSIGGVWEPLKVLQVGASYAWRYERFDNLGIFLMLQLGPVQLYGASDNILGLFNPYSVSNSNGRFGLNLRFE